MPTFRDSALDYHRSGRPGKIEVTATKPFTTQRDLSLAYTPGVAEPCRVIHETPEDAYAYTSKGNLVAVITNGTAVLGLGNIGALAGKPVMEGKGVLFKRFADIDVFDLEIDTEDPDEFIDTVRRLEPTFGGINLEDIRGPECFYIEERLRQQMNIPVFHDDQHGTAIIVGAALINALKLTGKRIEDIRLAINGAGAAAIACARLFLELGANSDHLTMCDSKGVIYKGRAESMNPYKEPFAVDTSARTLSDAARDADVLVGLSVKGAFTPDMLSAMASNPIVFALANPDPEIDYDIAQQVRSDIIIATGRSDYPNQVNNVLGFPFIFRGALDVRATAINEDMKIAAVHALANLTREEVPNSVLRAYGLEELNFGREYIIPKPFDHRVLFWVAPAVAEAAVKSGVARISFDKTTYRERLEDRLGYSREVIRTSIHKAKTDPRRIVFPEGEHDRILHACRILCEEKLAYPILLGAEEKIRKRTEELGFDLDAVTIENPQTSPRRTAYIDKFYALRQRKGITRREAERLVSNPNVFGSLMVSMDDADGLVSGITQHYPETIRPALQIIGTREGVTRVSGLYIMIIKNRAFFFADATVNIDPDAETLAEIALESARLVHGFDIEPRVALLSFSNFGSARHPFSERVRKAVEIVRQKAPDLKVDGEMQAGVALNPQRAREVFDFSSIQGDANVLIFPDLQSGNIAYTLLRELGGAETIGPILMGMKKPVHVLQRDSDINSIINMAAIAVLDAQARRHSESIQ